MCLPRVKKEKSSCAGVSIVGGYKKSPEISSLLPSIWAPTKKPVSCLTVLGDLWRKRNSYGSGWNKRRHNPVLGLGIWNACIIYNTSRTPVNLHTLKYFIVCLMLIQNDLDNAIYLTFVTLTDKKPQIKLSVCLEHTILPTPWKSLSSTDGLMYGHTWPMTIINYH